MSKILIPIAAAVSAALFAIVLYLIFYVTPLQPAPSLLFNQKIFYFHVPTAFVLFTSVFVCGIASILYLVRRKPSDDDLAQAAGSLAVLFGAAMLVTGSIWARASWGKWWLWDDPRLVTSFLLCLVMVGYVIVREYGGVGFRRLAAGLAIFAMVDVPLVYFSVKFKEAPQHPQTTVVTSLGPSMRLTFWLCVLAFMLLYLVLLTTRRRQARMRRRLYEISERGLDAGLSL